MREVELADGTILEFPDNTPDAVMLSAGKRITLERSAAKPPEAPEDPGLLGSLVSGMGTAVREFGQTGETLAGGKPEVIEEPNNPAAQSMEWGDVLRPKLLAEKTLYGLGRGAPSIAGGIVGALGGGQAGLALSAPVPHPLAKAAVVGAGVIGGEFLGSGLVSTAQSIGPYYAQALKDNPDNPDAAFDLALKQAGTEGVITGAAFAAFRIPVFKSTVKQILAQAFVVQPAVMATGQVAQGAVSGEGVTGADLAEAYPQAVIGTAVPLAGTHLAGRAVKRFLPKRKGPSSQEDLEDVSGGVTGEDIAAARETEPSAFRYDSDWYPGEEPSLFPGGLSSEGIPKQETSVEPPKVKRSTATTGDVLESQIQRRLNAGLIDEQQAKQIRDARAAGLKPFAAGTLLEQLTAENAARGRTPEVDTTPTPLEQSARDREDFARLQVEEELSNARTAAEQQAAETKLAALKQASEFESLSLEQGAERSQVSEASRRAVLLDTIENTPTNNYNTLAASFSRSLADQGFARVEPTKAELATIQRAIDVQRAQPEVPAPTIPLEEIRTAPGGAAELEARIPELAPPSTTPVQPSFPGMGGKRGTAPERPGLAPEAPTVPVAQTITPELLDGLGVSQQAPIRKRLVGKDLSDPTVRQQLVEFTKNQKVGQGTRLNIARMLEGVPDGQMELFQPRGTTGRIGTEGGKSGFPAAGREDVATRLTTETTKPTGERLGDTGEAAAKAGDGKILKPSELTAKRNEYLDSINQLVGDSVANVRELVRSGVTDPNQITSIIKPQLDQAIAAVSRVRAMIPDRMREGFLDIRGVKNPRVAKPEPVSNDVQWLGRDAHDALKVGNVKEALLNLETLRDMVDSGEYAKESRYNDPAHEKQKHPVERRQRVSDVRKYGIEPTKPGEGPKRPESGKGAEFKAEEGTSKTLASAKQRIRNALKREDINQRDHDMLMGLAEQRGVSPQKLSGSLDVVLKANKTPIKRDAPKGDIGPYTKLMAEGVPGGERDPVLVAGTVGKDGVSTMDKFKSGESADSLLKHIEENSTDENARKLARALRKTVPNDVSIRAMRPGEEFPPAKEVPEGYEGQKRPAYFDRNSKQVVFGAEHVRNTDSTLLHEFVHAATEDALARRTPAGKHIEEIFERFKKAAPKDESYGFTAAHEFVAEALSNPEFKATLNRMQDRGTTFWHRIVNTFRRMFGMPSLNYLERILDPNNILRSAARETMETITRDSSGKEISRGPYDAQWNMAAKKVKAAQTALDKVRASRNSGEIASGIKGIFASRSAKEASAIGRRAYKSLSPKGRRVWLFGLQTEDVFRNAKALVGDRVNNIDNLQAAFDKHDTLRNTLVNAGMKISERLTKYQAKAKGNDFTNLEDVVLGSTLEQVDLHKAMPKNASKSVKELYDVWKTLPPEAQTIYKDIFDFFDKQKGEQLKLTLDNIKDSALPQALKDQAIEEVKVQFKEIARVKRYFPLSRPGKYWLRFGSGADYGMRKFETVAARDTARDQYIEKLKAAGDTRDIDTLFADKEVATGDDMHSLRVELENRPDTILNRVNKIIEKASNKNAKEEIGDSVFQLYMDSLGGTDAARHWAPRKSDSPIGFSTDINRVFSARVMSGADHMARLAYHNRINTIVSGMYEAARGRADSDYIMPFIDSMAVRSKRITDPIAPDTIWDHLSQNGNKVVWVFMLTAPKSGVMNILQVPSVAMPVMAAEIKMPDGSQLGYTRASAALTKNFGTVFGVYDGGKIGDRFAAKKDADAPRLGEALGKIYEQLEAEGRWATTFMSTMYGTARGPSPSYAKDPISKVGRGTKAAIDWITSFFQMTESRSRQLVGMSTAEIEYTNAIKANKSHDEAMQIAKSSALKIVNEGMFNYTGWNKSELMTGGSGHGAVAAAAKTATQFSAFTTFFTSHIVRNAHTMFKGLDKAERKAAATKLFGTLGMVGMLGGVQGLGWLYGSVMAALNSLGLIMNEEDDDGDESNPLLNRNADAWFKDYFLPTYFGPGSGLAKTFGLDKESANALVSSIYSGPVSALTGMDISPSIRMELPFQKVLPFDSIFFSDEMPDLTDRTLLERALFQIASGPSGGLITQWQSGLSDIYKGDWYRGAEQMVPAIARGPIRSLRFFTEGSLTREGATIKPKEEFTPDMLVKQSLGFGNTELDELQRITFLLNKAQKQIDADRKEVYTAFDRARKSGSDSDDADAREALAEFNAKNPDTPIRGKEIRASVVSKATGRAGAILGVQPSKRYRGLTADVLNRYKEDEE